MWFSSLVVYVSAAALSLGATVTAPQQTASALNAAGVAQYDAKNYDQAIQSFEQAYQVAPDNMTVRHNLCNAYQAQADELAKKDDYTTAKAQLERAIDADPENPSPLVQLGAYDLKLDLTTDAIFRLEEAIQLAPDNVDANDLLGEAYYRNDNLAAALAHWNFVREKQPNRPNLQARIAKATREQAVEQNFKRTKSRHFTVNYAKGTAPQDLRHVLNILERAYIEIGRRFGGVYPPGPIQVIVYTTKGFTDETLLGRDIGGLYDGKIRVPFMDATGHTISEADLRRVLFHEYTHVVVRYLAGDNVPFWLNEGLAETFSCKLTSADLEILRRARDHNALFPLSQLESGQINKLSPDALRLAYLQSHATVKSLWDRFGVRGLSAMMDALAEHTPPEEALRQVYRRSYVLLEREVAASFSQPADR